MKRELQLFLDLESLTGEGSVKSKQILISANCSEKLEYFLDVCYNPFVTTKLNKLEFSETSEEKNLDWTDLVELIETLKSSPAANDSLRERAESFINMKMDENPETDRQIRQMLMKVLTKRMNIGIGAKTINKAMVKELIPDPSLMLATDNESEISDWSDIYCEEKYDGVRVIALVKNSGKDVTFFTRAFNELDPKCLSKISSEIKKVFANSGLLGEWFFDGELTDLDRKSVSGKVNQILKGTAKSDIDSSFLFNIFDLEEADTLVKGKGTITYSIRRDTLEGVLSECDENSSLRLGTMYKVTTKEEILEMYKRIVSQGGEGVIVKNDHLYECKRSKNWVKLKEVNECDLKITGWYPGEGKREGFIGGFICTDSSETLHVKIGSGFTDHDLAELSTDPDSLKGRIIAVNYNVTITDKFGNRSLFLPRFIELRHDKSEADDMSILFK
jgi:DNA ligase-1